MCALSHGISGVWRPAGGAGRLFCLPHFLCSSRSRFLFFFLSRRTVHVNWLICYHWERILLRHCISFSLFLVCWISLMLVVPHVRICSSVTFRFYFDFVILSRHAVIRQLRERFVEFPWKSETIFVTSCLRTSNFRTDNTRKVIWTDNLALIVL